MLRYLRCSGARLLNKQHQAFEVMTFWVKEVDGMISALAEVKHDPDISAGFNTGSNDGVIEKLGGDHLAAGECKE